MWGDVDIYVKFRILKCSKYTNFIKIMNAFLLASIFGCVSEVVCGEMFEAEHVRGSCQARSQNVRERERELSKVLSA